MAEQVGGEQVGLPRWFVAARRVFIFAYVAVIVACVVAAFGMMAIGAVVYRDFNSYTLAGNPWEHSSFPWHVIDSMRAMSIVGVMIAVAVGFVAAQTVFLFLSTRVLRPGHDELARRLICAALAALVVFAAAAWFGRWFG